MAGDAGNELIDPFGRHIEYVRLSVTDRCNLSCFYCMPKGHKEYSLPENWLSFEDITRIISAFARLGVRKVRITGGEPLIRKDLPVLAGMLSGISGIDDLSLSTNAVLLEKHAQALKEAGVSRMNVSLDTLRAERFKQITQGGRLDKVLRGLMAAKEAGFDPVKINMVALKGVNDDEYEDMVDYCTRHGFVLRLIETMPVGIAGRQALSEFDNLQKIRKKLTRRYGMVPVMGVNKEPARYMEIAGSQTRVGFITPMSQHFCESCNRVRLSGEGAIYLCLGHKDKLELRPLLNKGASDEELELAIKQAVALKPERHEFREDPGKIVRFMSLTGG